MGESAIVRKIVRYIESIGGKAIKIHGDAFSVVGAPDIIACITGQFWAIEVKDDTSRPDPAQEVQLKRWYDAGAHTMVAYSVDDVQEAVARVQKKEDGKR